MLEEQKSRYIDLIIKSGLDVQQGDYIFVHADVVSSEFIEQITEAMYKAGAAAVTVRYGDPKLTRLKGLYAEDALMDVFPESSKMLFEEQLAKNAKRLVIHSPDPDVLAAVDSTRLMRMERAMRAGTETYRQAIMKDDMNWTIAAVPNQAWAEKIFPNDDKAVVVAKLWDAIFDSVHLNDGPDANENWMNHVKQLWQRSETLTDMQLHALRYTNNLGTDITVGLPKGHVWLGGGSTNAHTKTFFSPNMPTEEVYTLGDANRVDGIVYSALPLLFAGQMIDKFNLTFKDGAVVEAHAEVGNELLQEILKTDDGARRIGEVALVPYESPISLTGLLFYNTLFDENASCHFAIGAAYANSLPASIGKTDEEKKAMGFNESINHIDFMIGTKDLDIVGIKEDGTEVQIFQAGNFAI
jgi:aminopeptidase